MSRTLVAAFAVLLLSATTVGARAQQAASVALDSLRVQPVAHDTLPVVGRRLMVYNEPVSGTPVYVTLDSGVVYRFVTSEAIRVMPRQGFRTPLTFAAARYEGATGTPLVPTFTGEYRIEAEDRSTVASVQIYRVDADVVAGICFQNPRDPSCRSLHPRRRFNVLALALALPAMGLLHILFR